MRGFFGFLKGSYPSAPKAAKCFPRARRLALETLESRLTPSASMDNPVLNLYRVFLDRVAEAPALAAWSGALESRRISPCLRARSTRVMVPWRIAFCARAGDEPPGALS